jgi:hypothetical protein
MLQSAEHSWPDFGLGWTKNVTLGPFIEAELLPGMNTAVSPSTLLKGYGNLTNGVPISKRHVLGGGMGTGLEMRDSGELTQALWL